MDDAIITQITDRTLILSNLSKVFWPGPGFTKADLIGYYHEISSYILPHLHHRPLVITRFPHGVAGKWFYQKNMPDHAPDWLPTFAWTGEKDNKTIHYLLAEETAALVWLANQGAIEIHPWLSSVEKPDYPDFLIFDLDPSDGNTFDQVVEAALVCRKLLDEMGLRSYLKTSGGDGLHIYVPIKPDYPYQTVREAGRAVAVMAAEILPVTTTIERSVQKRGNKIYLDYMQNVRGKTICAPYSVRPRPQATVSTPLRWEEIHATDPTRWTIRTILNRVGQVGDLFQPVLEDRQSLDAVLSLTTSSKESR